MLSKNSARKYRFGIAALSLALMATAASAQHQHAGADARRAIPLAPPQRDMILSEMRQFLRGVEQITRAAATGDMQAVAVAARPLGKQATHAVPADLMQKLPPEFRALGSSVHADFDQIALDAESLGDTRHTLLQVSDTLGKCNGCHEAFRLTESAAAHE